MKCAFTLILLAATVTVFVGCQSSSTATDKLYPLKGTVVSVNSGANEVTIDHEDIPGLMKAMKMTFTVEDAKLLEGVNPGSHVEGKVKESGGKYILTEFQSHGEHVAEAEKVRAALAKLSPEDRTLAEAQQLCSVSEEPLGSMGVPIRLVLKGESVFICCKSCKADAEKDPEKTVKKAIDLKAKNAPK